MLGSSVYCTSRDPSTHYLYSYGICNHGLFSDGLSSYGLGTRPTRTLRLGLGAQSAVPASLTRTLVHDFVHCVRSCSGGQTIDKIKSIYACANAECLHMHAHESLSLHTSPHMCTCLGPQSQGRDATCSAFVTCLHAHGDHRSIGLAQPRSFALCAC